MAKLTIGSSHNNSTLKLHAELGANSTMELHVGNGYDMSIREISIIEKSIPDIDHELSHLRALANNFTGDTYTRLREESEKVASTAKKIISERKWYDVSASGLIEAAKAVGEAASPLIESAIKIVTLLKQAKV
jgi:hypothetical protein